MTANAARRHSYEMLVFQASEDDSSEVCTLSAYQIFRFRVLSLLSFDLDRGFG